MKSHRAVFYCEFLLALSLVGLAGCSSSAPDVRRRRRFLTGRLRRMMPAKVKAEWTSVRRMMKLAVKALEQSFRARR